MTISASVVLFNCEPAIIRNLVSSLIVQGVQFVYLVDNSQSNNKSDYSNLPNTGYYHYPNNLGFGAAHNRAIEMAMLKDKGFHFVVNPDIQLCENVISTMVNYMIKDPSIGMMMPEILNTNGSVQYLPKLLPSPMSLVKRKLKLPINIYDRFVENYELRFVPRDVIYSCPILSGCFSLFNLEAIRNVGSYDESFFMYFEDFDISRRINKKYKTIYFPFIQVIHGYNSEANKSLKLLFIFIFSGIKYFNKWGWIIDSERDKINLQTLSQFEK
jgi:GT2 family glycosyltransferase